MQEKALSRAGAAGYFPLEEARLKRQVGPAPDGCAAGPDGDPYLWICRRRVDGDDRTRLAGSAPVLRFVDQGAAGAAVGTSGDGFLKGAAQGLGQADAYPGGLVIGLGADAGLEGG